MRGAEPLNVLHSSSIYCFMSFLLCHQLEYLPEESFNVEQVVQCLCHSINPQTQHLSLLLLSTTASIYPVSCSIISIVIIILRSTCTFKLLMNKFCLMLMI